MKLYQINQSQYPKSVEDDWTLSLLAGDAIMLIEAGILRAITQVPVLTELEKKGIQVFLRQADVEAYGIHSIVGKALSDLEWVELTQTYPKIVSW